MDEDMHVYLLRGTRLGGVPASKQYDPSTGTTSVPKSLLGPLNKALKVECHEVADHNDLARVLADATASADQMLVAGTPKADPGSVIDRKGNLGGPLRLVALDFDGVLRAPAFQDCTAELESAIAGLPEHGIAPLARLVRDKIPALQGKQCVAICTPSTGLKADGYFRLLFLVPDGVELNKRSVAATIGDLDHYGIDPSTLSPKQVIFLPLAWRAVEGEDGMQYLPAADPPPAEPRVVVLDGEEMDWSPAERTGATSDFDVFDVGALGDAGEPSDDDIRALVGGPEADVDLPGDSLLRQGWSLADVSLGPKIGLTDLKEAGPQPRPDPREVERTYAACRQIVEEFVGEKLEWAEEETYGGIIAALPRCPLAHEHTSEDGSGAYAIIRLGHKPGAAEPFEVALYRHGIQIRCHHNVHGNFAKDLLTESADLQQRLDSYGAIYLPEQWDLYGGPRPELLRHYIVLGDKRKNEQAQWASYLIGSDEHHTALFVKSTNLRGFARYLPDMQQWGEVTPKTPAAISVFSSRGQFLPSVEVAAKRWAEAVFWDQLNYFQSRKYEFSPSKRIAYHLITENIRDATMRPPGIGGVTYTKNDEYIARLAFEPSKPPKSVFHFDGTLIIGDQVVEYQTRQVSPDQAPIPLEVIKVRPRGPTDISRAAIDAILPSSNNKKHINAVRLVDWYISHMFGGGEQGEAVTKYLKAVVRATILPNVTALFNDGLFLDIVGAPGTGKSLLINHIMPPSDALHGSDYINQIDDKFATAILDGITLLTEDDTSRESSNALLRAMDELKQIATGGTKWINRKYGMATRGWVEAIIIRGANGLAKMDSSEGGWLRRYKGLKVRGDIRTIPLMAAMGDEVAIELCRTAGISDSEIGACVTPDDVESRGFGRRIGAVLIQSARLWRGSAMLLPFEEAAKHANNPPGLVVADTAEALSLADPIGSLVDLIEVEEEPDCIIPMMTHKWPEAPTWVRVLADLARQSNLYDLSTKLVQKGSAEQRRAAELLKRRFGKLGALYERKKAGNPKPVWDSAAQKWIRGGRSGIDSSGTIGLKPKDWKPDGPSRDFSAPWEV